MEHLLKKMKAGYQAFREKYALGEDAIMRSLAHQGQKPEIMVVACSDSRVDPALILQCDPGDLFVVRNVANIIPPYEKDSGHHGVSAALEFGICYLNVKHLIILGHSQCGGINALLNQETLHQDDFISKWVSLIKCNHGSEMNVESYAQHALKLSYKNCLTFPWIKNKVEAQELALHLWFFNIKKGEILTYQNDTDQFTPFDNTP